MLETLNDFARAYENPVVVVQKGREEMAPMRITQNLHSFNS